MQARPWSRYSKGSSAYLRLHPEEKEAMEKKASEKEEEVNEEEEDEETKKQKEMQKKKGLQWTGR